MKETLITIVIYSILISILGIFVYAFIFYPWTVSLIIGIVVLLALAYGLWYVAREIRERHFDG